MTQTSVLRQLPLILDGNGYVENAGSGDKMGTLEMWILNVKGDARNADNEYEYKSFLNIHTNIGHIGNSYSKQ